jgi:pseudouridine synthase
MKTLDRVLSKAGLGSRTEARQWIAEGRVRVNGKAVQTPDAWVDLTKDKVLFDGKPLESAEPVYLLLYKPKGYVTTYKDPDGRPTVYDLLKNVKEFVGTVGRLDLDSSGLLLMMNDHLLADRLTSPEYHVEKEYLVKASTLLTEEQLAQMRQSSEGVVKVERVRDSEKYTHLRVILTEGKNRQVRKMVDDVGSHVLKLVRIRIGPLTMGTLEIGKYRLLTSKEVQQLKVLTKLHVDSKSKGKLLLHQGNRSVLGGRRRRKRT